MGAAKGNIMKKDLQQREQSVQRNMFEGILSIRRSEGGSLKLSRGQRHLKGSVWPVCELSVSSL